MPVACPGCRGENPDGARFCNQCGATLAAACGACGHENPAGSRFCNGCGAALAAAPTGPGAAGPAAERNPLEYLPEHLAEKIRGLRGALEGERKQVTVLFADVKSSMDLQESLDPEDWKAITDRFFQILAEGVHRFEGTVNQYTGDGIMALFGAPIAHEDHAQRACYAALHLVDTLREYSIELRRERGLDFSVRMGINSGEVVVGKIGDDLRMDYTAQGHTVGLASRMENLAEPGKVYLTGATAAYAQGYFDLEDLGPFKVKGVSEPVPVFELAGVGSVRTRFDLSRARGLSRFVGRDADVQILENALAGARAGKGRAIGVVAPAGVGKSRLCFEFAERCRQQGLRVMYGSGVAHGRNIPLLPILQIFRAYFAIDERDDPRSAREKIAGRLLLIDEKFRDVLPIVFDFLGVPDPKRPVPRMDPDVRQRRVVAVMRTLIERASPDGFVIVIEDLHWVDAASEAFVAEYVDAIANGPGLLLLNFRPEYRAEWMKLSWYQRLPLDPLGPEALRELVGDLLGDDPSVTGLADRIHELTEGNPYFAEEIVRSLADRGVLAGAKGGYRLTQPVQSIQVPGSVNAVLSARIDRLPEREKRVLQTAAVVGREFAEPILAAAADLPEADLSAALSALQGSEFIHQQSLYPVAEYAFAHPLTQEVALGSQLQEQRRKAHAAVAAAIEEAYPDEQEANAALIAHHYEEAGREVDAARWHARAATWVGARDFTEAMRHAERVRDLLVALPAKQQTDETQELRLGACSQIVIGGWRLGLAEAAMASIFEEGCALAEQLGSHSALAALRGGYGGRLASLGRLREALAMTEENIAETDPIGDRAARAGPRVGFAYYNMHLGNLETALDGIREGAAIVGDDLVAGREVFGFGYAIWFHGNAGLLRAMQGHCAEAAEALQGALRMARESEIPENLAWANGNVASLALYTGERNHPELGDAVACVGESIRLAEETGSTFSRVVTHGVAGVLHTMLGDWAEAQALLENALQIARDRRVGLEWEPYYLAYLARAILAQGDAEGALALAEESVRLAAERGQRLLEISGQLALGRARCALGRAQARADVEAACARAETLVAETGGHGYGPWIPELRAELARACGDAVSAERRRREALRAYEAIGAGGHARRLAQAP